MTKIDNCAIVTITNGTVVALRKGINMDKVYEDNGGFTEEASALADKVRNNLKELIRYELEMDTPIEVLEYIILSTIHTEILSQKLRIKLGKDTNV